MKKKRETHRKKLEHFIKDESGSISKDKILKIGLGTITAIGIISAFSSNLMSAHGSHSSHNNSLTLTPAGGSCGKLTHASHDSHGSHGSY